MKSFKYVFLTIAAIGIFQTNIHSVDSVITFFIKEAQGQKKPSTPQGTNTFSQPLTQPSFIRGIPKNISWIDQEGIDGIEASYLGYFTISNKSGQISFPRKQQKDEIHLLITPEVKPIFMIEPLLIHHWEIKSDQPAALYLVTRKVYKDVSSKIYYFDIKKIDLPANKEIPLNTITIYADPERINVQTGPSLNTYSTNFVLPVLQGNKIKTIKNSLYTLSIKQYFEQINIESKNDTLGISTMITNQ